MIPFLPLGIVALAVLAITKKKQAPPVVIDDNFAVYPTPQARFSVSTRGAMDAIIYPAQSSSGQQPPTLPPTEPPTFPPTEPPTFPPTEPPTFPPTEPPTLPPTEPPTLPPTMPPANPGNKGKHKGWEKQGRV